MRNILIIIAVLYCGTVKCQQLTSYNLSHLPQRSNMNPAFAPHSKLFVGIPLLSGISNSYSNNGFCYQDLFRRNGNNLLILDIENAISKMDDRNHLAGHSETELLGIGYKVGKNYLSLNVTEKADLSFSYTRSFFEFLYYGNTASMGTIQQFNPGVEGSHYREYGIAWSRPLASFLNAGVRIKYLYGMEHILTAGEGVSIYTNPDDFALSASSDYTIYTSGMDTSSFTDMSLNEYAFGKKNKGYGIDLGVTATPLPSVEISLSMIDLGSIKWTTENAIHHTKTGDDFYFAGINLNEFIHNDSLNAATYIEQIGDSMENSFNVTTTRESYRYTLPLQIYGSVSYLLSEQYRVSVLVKNKHSEHLSQTDYQLSFTGKTKHWLNYTLAINKVNRTPVTVGAGFALNFRNTQYYFASDNIPGLINWKKAYNTGFRAGINIMTGTKHKAQPAPQPMLLEPEASVK